MIRARGQVTVQRDRPPEVRGPTHHQRRVGCDQYRTNCEQGAENHSPNQRFQGGQSADDIHHKGRGDAGGNSKSKNRIPENRCRQSDQHGRHRRMIKVTPLQIFRPAPVINFIIGSGKHCRQDQINPQQQYEWQQTRLLIHETLSIHRHP